MCIHVGKYGSTDAKKSGYLCNVCSLESFYVDASLILCVIRISIINIISDEMQIVSQSVKSYSLSESLL